ncbi:PpiC-type peptidyl-prolyl cis-trans isomerase [Calothrix sp. NIES-4101]|nr:PpiC-type peptidyl-prolyl cis-trans isomerase [Calothrix sp. NIES-4101]
MSQTITITNEEIINEIKLSCKMPEIVEQIMTRKVIENTAKEVGIKVSNEALQETADALRLMSKLETADDTWAWLKKFSLTLDNFEQIAYTNYISGQLAHHLFANKVEPYFFEHQLNYAGVAMYEVVLDDEDLAIELFYAIKEGEISFHDVACQYIEDKELRRKGGYKGVVHRKDLKPEISAAVFTAQAPQLFKPIVTSKGAHLILVEELIKPILDDKLRATILVDMFSEWLKQQIELFEVIQ